MHILLEAFPPPDTLNYSPPSRIFSFSPTSLSYPCGHYRNPELEADRQIAETYFSLKKKTKKKTAEVQDTSLLTFLFSSSLSEYDFIYWAVLFTNIFFLLKKQNDLKGKTVLQHLSISTVEFPRTNFNS